MANPSPGLWPPSPSRGEGDNVNTFGEVLVDYICYDPLPLPLTRGREKFMLNFQIATPEKVVLKEKIDKISIPTELGEITVLPGHIPLIANIVPGELTIHKGSDTMLYAVTGGFVEIRPGDNVIILADAAEHVEEIDIQRAQEAAEKAKKMMAGVKADDVKFTEASALLERSLARIKVARKKKHHEARTPYISQG